MQVRILDILTNEKLLRLSGACAADGRPLTRQVFFEPDCWELPDEFDRMLRRHAGYLLDHPDTIAVLSGHSYGTGSQRFFWLMGDRRALAVRHALHRAGVPASQMRIQSVGEARPSIELAGDELARYRRRVTIDYVQAGDEDLARIAQPGSPDWWRSVLGAGQGKKLPGGIAFHPRQSSSAASRPGNNTSV
ncbi:MAG: OmpA family protein [Bdellovibrionales bacterium]|nr:OmpA family protein [Ramlibacter sp.]